MSSLAEYKSYLSDYLIQYHNITNLKKFFHCLNPEHTDNNPSMMFTDKYNICKCFSCGASYDIFDLVGMDFKIYNFRDKIKKVEELYKGYVPEYREYKPEEQLKNDYTNYYNKCERDINKSSYLEERGIDKSLIKKYYVGYDEKRNLVVFPITKYCYFARSTINSTKLKSKGNSDIWNKDLLDNNENLIYITEGIIDSLSLETIDPNIKTISINGVGNIHALIHTIKEKQFNGTVVIVFDNDAAGIRAAKDLKEDLAKLNVNSFSTTLVSNFDDNDVTDINSALINNREKLERNYQYFDTCFKAIIEKKELEKEGDLLLAG